jgi:hypothetical protein
VTSWRTADREDMSTTALIPVASLAPLIAGWLVAAWRRRATRRGDPATTVPPIDWDRFMDDLDSWQRRRGRPASRNG